MTKIKNTKKGMAKKTLSMSLVVAMLATSNVPVWAAEFSDGSDVAVATEAPAAEAFDDDADAAPVVDDSDNADVAQAGETKVSFTLKENGWGKAAALDKLDLAGITAADGAVGYQWKVDGKVVDEGNNTSIQDIQTNHMYTPDKLDCGKTLQLVLFRDASATIGSADPMKFSFESNVVTISKNNISNCTPTISTKSVSYDGKEHNDANDWITSLSVTAATGYVLTYANGGGDFNVTVEGTKGLVNTDSEITLRIQPRDTEYYTGEISVSTANNAGSTKLGIAKVAYNAADKNITAELANPTVVYNGKDQTPKKEDIVLKDTKSGAVLDSKTVIKSISITKGGTAASTAAEAGEYKVSVVLNNDKTNYSISSGDITISNVDFTIKKVDLSNCTVILNDLKTQNGQITPSQLSVKEIRDKDGNAYTYLNPNAFEVTSVQSNTGAVGNYTATVKAKDNCVNYEGTATATFTVYNQKLEDVNAKFDGKVKVNGVETPYASMAEDYTGAAITKDAAKLGKLMATDKNNKTYELLPNVSYDPNFTYERNTDAGTAVLVVKGIGDYAGSTLRVNFPIKAASVADKDVKAAEKVVYVEDDAKKAESYAPELTVIGKNTATPAKEFNLVKDKDYTVEYFYTKTINDRTETGTNDLGNFVCTKITIKNKNFWGLDTSGANNTSAPAAVYRYSKISKPQAGTWTVSTEKPSYTYTGEAIIPELIVKDGSKELEKDVDYEIKSIANGTNVGTATVTLAGKGDYDTTSTTTTTFTITPADMSSLTVNVNDQKYTGHQIRPTVSVSGNVQITAKLGKVNIDLSQFTISYPDSKDANKEVGTGTLTLAPKTTNKNFVGSKEVSFKIVGQTITHTSAIDNAFKVYDENGKEVDVANASFIYDGKAHTFASASFNYAYTDPITHKTVKLEEGKDFEIKYFHNVTGDANDKAYIAVVGKGNYAGDNTQTFEDENGKKVNAITYKAFTITPVTLSDQNVSVANGTYAEGMAVKPVVTVSYGRDSLTLKEGKDYELVGAGAYTEPTGTKKYTVSVKGINGYTGQTKQFSWGIDKKDLSSCDVTATKNAAGTVSVVVMNGNVKVPSEKYVVAENTDGTVTVTPAKDSKYYVGSKTVATNGNATKVGAPMITNVKVVGNKATVVLSGEAEGASGYDYVISKANDTATDRVDVTKNQVKTTGDFNYVQQGTYYAYCHAWTRDANGKKIFGEWSNIYPFFVSAITPAQPVITSVKANGNTVTVTYTKAANADGYDVVLGSAAKKVNGEYRPVEYGKLVKKNIKGNVVTATFKNVKKGTYYAGLHAFNRTSEDGKKVFSQWSNVKKVTVK